MRYSASTLCPPSEEHAIVERAKAHDEAAFELLYYANYRRVTQLCRRFVRNPAEAEELCQDIFLVVHRKLHTFRGESKFSTWLTRVAINEALMRLRKTTREETLSLPLEEMLTNDSGEKYVAEGKYPLQRKEMNPAAVIDRALIEKAVRSLPPTMRLIFILHDMEGYQHQEIAPMLHMTIPATKSQLMRARDHLRSYILGELPRSAYGKKPECAETEAVLQ